MGAITGPGDTRVGCGSATFGAENASTSAEFDPSQCRVQATVELQTLREGGETTVKGGGALAFSDGGQYFLPSVVSANVEVMSGAEAVCPQWAAELVGAVNVSSGGVLWFAGEGGGRDVKQTFIFCGTCSPNVLLILDTMCFLYTGIYRYLLLIFASS